MRILVTIPHFYKLDADARYGSSKETREKRAAAVGACIASMHQHFGSDQGMLDHPARAMVPANSQAQHQIRVVVFTDGDNHLIEELPVREDLFEHRPATDLADPKHLGFSALRYHATRLGDYDFHVHLEDDLVVHDAWFFTKLRWFLSTVGEDSVLVPNRYELTTDRKLLKVYPDGPLARQLTSDFQNIDEQSRVEGTVLGRPVAFIRTPNPHFGGFFLSSSQMAKMVKSPGFGEPCGDFIGPLESSATLALMKSFRVYKPAPECAGFLEIEHRSDFYAQMV